MNYTLCPEDLPVFSYCTLHKKMTPSPTPNHPLATPHKAKPSAPFLIAIFREHCVTIIHLTTLLHSKTCTHVCTSSLNIKCHLLHLVAIATSTTSPTQDQNDPYGVGQHSPTLPLPTQVLHRPQVNCCLCAHVATTLESIHVRTCVYSNQRIAYLT